MRHTTLPLLRISRLLREKSEKSARSSRGEETRAATKALSAEVNRTRKMESRGRGEGGREGGQELREGDTYTKLRC